MENIYGINMINSEFNEFDEEYNNIDQIDQMKRPKLTHSISTNSTSTITDLDADQKRLRRLERNRDSARECRKRKKDKSELLRQELVQVEAENVQLRMKLKVGPEAAKAENDQVAQFTAQLDVMIHDGASEETIREFIYNYQERFSDYGRDRRSAIEFHLKSLKGCLQPTQTTRTILWLFSKVPEFLNPDGTPTTDKTGMVAELYYSLLHAINATPEQNKRMAQLSMSAEMIKDRNSTSISAPTHTSTTATNDDSDTKSGVSSDSNKTTGSGLGLGLGSASTLPPVVTTFPELKSVATETSAVLNRIETLIADKNESLDSEMKKLQSVFNARQIAKFLLWIEKNPACMHMLEVLWPHVQPTESSFS